MSKASTVVTFRCTAKTRVVRSIRLLLAAAVLVATGALSTLLTTLLMTGPKPAGAAAQERHPGIVSIALDAPLTEKAVYPPGIALGNFDDAYRMATMYSATTPGIVLRGSTG